MVPKERNLNWDAEIVVVYSEGRDGREDALL